MIKLENWEVVGWEHAIRGMRNPMNSWGKSEGNYRYTLIGRCDNCEYFQKQDWTGCDECDTYRLLDEKPEGFMIGPNDAALMMRLAKGGPVHAKYRRMITVYVDITAPLYWWKEFDTYKVGTVANSCSTMHKIHAKEFTLEDFSCEKLITGFEEPDTCANIYISKVLGDIDNEVTAYPMDVFSYTIDILNVCRELYLETKDKLFWHQMIQLLPTSYNQKRTVMLNYEVLHNIYYSRKNHKLDEWHVLCDWIKNLPYSEVICCEEEEKNV